MKRSASTVATAIALTGATFGLAGSAHAAGRPPGVRSLIGSVHLIPGSCRNGRPSGSYLAVTFGTRAVKNPGSSCDDGAVTLLSPAATALQTDQFSLPATAVFDHRALTLRTAPQGIYPPPRLYLVGDQISADVRSVEASYGGGQWPIGTELATGHYNRATRRLSLRWFSGESFTPTSAGTSVHLVGRFVGAEHQLRKGTTVQLGTASFDAGAPDAVTAAVQQARRGTHRSGRHDHRHAARLAADVQHTGGSPKTFLLAELLVLADLAAFVAMAWRTRRSGQK
jgi:hypothetical protein